MGIYYLYEVKTFPSRHTFPMLIFYLLLTWNGMKYIKEKIESISLLSPIATLAHRKGIAINQQHLGLWRKSYVCMWQGWDELCCLKNYLFSILLHSIFLSMEGWPLSSFQCQYYRWQGLVGEKAEVQQWDGSCALILPRPVGRELQSVWHLLSPVGWL